MRFPAACAVALALTTSCSSTPAKVFEVYGDADSTELELAVTTCNVDPKVTAEESSTDVRLTVHAELDRNSNDCADSARVILKEPLGSRVVVDEATDAELVVLPPESG